MLVMSVRFFQIHHNGYVLRNRSLHLGIVHVNMANSWVPWLNIFCMVLNLSSPDNLFNFLDLSLLISTQRKISSMLPESSYICDSPMGLGFEDMA